MKMRMIGADLCVVGALQLSQRKYGSPVCPLDGSPDCYYVTEHLSNGRVQVRALNTGQGQGNELRVRPSGTDALRTRLQTKHQRLPQNIPRSLPSLSWTNKPEQYTVFR